MYLLYEILVLKVCNLLKWKDLLKIDWKINKAHVDNIRGLIRAN